MDVIDPVRLLKLKETPFVRIKILFGISKIVL